MAEHRSIVWNKDLYQNNPHHCHHLHRIRRVPQIESPVTIVRVVTVIPSRNRIRKIFGNRTFSASFG